MFHRQEYIYGVKLSLIFLFNKTSTGYRGVECFSAHSLHLMIVLQTTPIPHLRLQEHHVRGILIYLSHQLRFGQCILVTQ
jgi:hypothetical protein